LHGRQFESTGSFHGFLSSVPGDAEGLGQVQGSVVQRQPMHGSPEIKRVALHTAILLEASKSILAQVDRKGPFLIRRMAVHRTAPATLRTRFALTIHRLLDISSKARIPLEAALGDSFEARNRLPLPVAYGPARSG
jgi:hypothetical protein